MSAILTSIVSFLLRAILAPLNSLLGILATAGALHDLLTYPGVAGLIAGVQGVAGAILAVRVAWEAIQMATVRAEGAATDPGGLLKRTAMAAAAIFAGPWLTTEALTAGNDLAHMVASAGLGGSDLALVSQHLATYSAHVTVDMFLSIMVFTLGVILIVLVFIQSIIRTIEITLAAIVSPIMALGFISGGGTADVWWREVLVLASSQAVQLTVLFLGVDLLVAPAPGLSLFLSPYLFLGACWVAWRTPHVLRQYAYHTGVGSAAGSAGSTAANVGMKMVLSKLPF